MGVFDSVGFGNVLDFASNVTSSLIEGAQARKAAKTAYHRQVALMDMQNAYNTPAAQMERLKEAGLNPMLVFGHGSVAGSTSAAPPAVAKAAPTKFDMRMNAAAAIKMSQDLQLGQAQIEQVEANTLSAIQSILNMQSNKKKIDAEKDSILYNLGIAKSRGTRDASLNSSEGLATFMEKLFEGFTERRLRRNYENEKFNKLFFDWW